MKNILRNIKGTKDISAEESYIWQYIENYIHNFFDSFGYSEVRTPTFENTELFVRSIGGDTDIVSKEMYSWTDQGNNTLTLRPEFTASVVRYFIQNQLHKINPSHKIYYIGSSFRRERPQKGRLREFRQFGIEAFGSKNPEQDAEIISMAYNFYKNLDISNLKLELNSIGSKESRIEYRKVLKSYLEKFKTDLSEVSQKRLESNPLRILDTKIDFEKDIIKDAPKIIDYLSENDQKSFSATLDLLDSIKIPYTINNYLVRGLDYYSQTVFEIQSDLLGAQSALCGGGRYDYLVEELGGKPTPAIGFAAGIERLILAIENNNSITKKNPDIYIISMDESSYKYSFVVENRLRRNKKLKIISDKLRRTMKSQMKDANRLMAKNVIIIGEEEMNSGQLTLKDMNTGDQQKLTLDNIVDHFK
tara:strand:- start:1131 stop:2384 length:1254 start_codon:yes stop_codon:yes gene_type:complete